MPNQEVLFDLVSLGGLFNGNQAIEAMSDLSIEKAAFALCEVDGLPVSEKMKHQRYACQGCGLLA